MINSVQPRVNHDPASPEAKQLPVRNPSGRLRHRWNAIESNPRKQNNQRVHIGKKIADVIVLVSCLQSAKVFLVEIFAACTGCVPLN